MPFQASTFMLTQKYFREFDSDLQTDFWLTYFINFHVYLPRVHLNSIFIVCINVLIN